MKDIIKIGILSDTHGLLRPQVLQAFEGCSMILHAGDIGREQILDTLSRQGSVYAVRGNTDYGWAERIALFQDYTVHGMRFYITHRKEDLPWDLTPYDLVVYGHTHRYDEKRVAGTVMLNPGSCGPKRFFENVTCAVAAWDEQTRSLSVRRILLEEEPSRNVRPLPVEPAQIERVIRLVQKGKTVAQIAAGCNMDPKLAEQICRLYLTHPGVDAEGILAKMGL